VLLTARGLTNWYRPVQLLSGIMTVQTVWTCDLTSTGILSEATLTFDVDALQVDLVPGYKRLLGSVPGRTAFIIISPTATAYGMLVSAANPGWEMEVFSTRGAAEAWIHSKANPGAN